MHLNPLLTPLPATLSAHLTAASAEEASDLAAEQAEAMAELSLVPPLQPPALTDAVLCDHRQSLALFTQFFKAAAAAEAAESPTSPRAASAKAASDARREAAALKLAAGALAIDLRLHAQAEDEVLYPALAQRCGPQGALLARHARREHAEIGAELDAVLEALLKEGAATPAGTREQRRELVKLLQQLEQTFVAHQVEEETEILPRVAALPGQEQRRLAAAFFHSKRSAGLLLAGPSASSRPSTSPRKGPGEGGGVPMVTTPH